MYCIGCRESVLKLAFSRLLFVGPGFGKLNIGQPPPPLVSATLPCLTQEARGTDGRTLARTIENLKTAPTRRRRHWRAPLRIGLKRMPQKDLRINVRSEKGDDDNNRRLQISRTNFAPRGFPWKRSEAARLSKIRFPRPRTHEPPPHNKTCSSLRSEINSCHLPPQPPHLFRLGERD